MVNKQLYFLGSHCYFSFKNQLNRSHIFFSKGNEKELNNIPTLNTAAQTSEKNHNNNIMLQISE